MRPQLAPLSQGIFYVATGLWPILHLRSFEAVTGPKADGWLARTAGGLIAAIGLALVVGSRERPTRALRWLGVGSALVLAGADVVYVGRGRISKVYLADAAAEGIVVGAWALTRK